ncbi:MAG: DUF456 domain-containing protein [Phycisphaerales bacterium]
MTLFMTTLALTFSDVLDVVPPGLVILAGIVGIALTALTLPGTWLNILVALLCWWWKPDMFSIWTIVVALIIAIAAEAVEFGASALGAAKAGGSRKGQIGSLVGALAGAIVGSFFFFPIGTILGGAIGAGAGAVLAERVWAKRAWNESAKSGQGAAIGRLLATVGKTTLAIILALVLGVAAVYNPTPATSSSASPRVDAPNATDGIGVQVHPPTPAHDTPAKNP